MRQIIAIIPVLAAGLVVTLSAAQTPAAPAVKLPTPHPGIVPQNVRPARVVSAKKQGSPAYTGDNALTFEVEIESGAATPVATNLVVTALIPTTSSTPTVGGQVARVPVRLPARGRATVTYSNPKGLTDGCSPSYHRLAVEGGATTILKIVPTCSFGATTSNPETGMAPDRIVSMHGGRVSYHTARMPRRVPVCRVPVIMAATLQNQTPGNVSAAYLEVVGPHGEKTSYPPPKAALRANESRVIEVLGPRFTGQAGRFVLRVGANVEAAKVHQVNFGANISRLCSVKTELTNAVTPLPAPAPQRGE